MKNSKDYRRLIGFATGIKDRFGLILVSGTHFQVQRQWREQFHNDLKGQDIQVVHIRGDAWKSDSGQSITAFIKEHIPASGRYVISLSHFDYYMMPGFPENLKERSLLKEIYQAEPTPPSFVQRLNFERDALIKECPVPIFIWLSEAAVRQVAEHAPDFYDFRHYIIALPQPEHVGHIPETSFISPLKPGMSFDEAQRSGMSQGWQKEQTAYYYQSAGQNEKAFSAWKEAVVLYREAVVTEANIYLPSLVNALNRGAVLSARQARPMEAREVFAEALRFGRRLEGEEPGVHAPMLAEVLNNYALLLAGLKENGDAETYYNESVKIYRTLSGREYRGYLAQVLNNSGGLMVSMNRLDVALPLLQESLHLRRLSFAADFEPGSIALCQSLYNLALVFEKMGYEEEAQLIYEEAETAGALLAKVSGASPDDSSGEERGNPYKYRCRLPADSEMFFGREREIGRLLDLLSGDSPQSVSIVGERRIGKSSLATRVFYKLREKEDIVAIYVDCDFFGVECESGNDFFSLLSDRFKKTYNERESQEQIPEAKAVQLKAFGSAEPFSRKGPQPHVVGFCPPEASFSDYRGFRRFVGELSGMGKRVVVFFDEFEHLPDRGFADDSFFSNLRALADKPEYRLSFVTISRTQIKKLIHQAIQSSGFYNIFETCSISLLDHRSIKELRRFGFPGEGFSLSQEELKKIDYYAGDFAFFNQVVCGCLWESKKYNDAPDWDNLEVKLRPYYDTLWDTRTREEQAVLKKLKKENESDAFAYKAMKARGLVMRPAEEGYYLFCDFFGHLMEKELEVRKKDILGKGVLNTIKEVLGILKSAKELVQ
ncbi:MAG: tetratricopeptide repeat protein [bacterium]|nr:tetratricopeptide repeat protein [bacterium]